MLKPIFVFCTLLGSCSSAQVVELPSQPKVSRQEACEELETTVCELLTRCGAYDGNPYSCIKTFGEETDCLASPGRTEDIAACSAELEAITQCEGVSFPRICLSL